MIYKQKQPNDLHICFVGFCDCICLNGQEGFCSRARRAKQITWKMKALLKMIFQCSIQQNTIYREESVAERRENTGTKITVYRATDLNCKASLGMSFFLPYFVLYVASKLNDYPCICPEQLIYEHVAGSEVCFRIGPHESRGEGQ